MDKTKTPSLQGREIRFRVWDGNKMWHPIEHNCHVSIWGSEGFIPWGLYSNGGGERLVTGDPKAIFNSPGVLMQFTGLRDKSGKEIYEGDILARDKYTNWVVAYYDREASFRIYNATRPGESYIMHKMDLEEEREVIGNIYENGHLLKTEGLVVSEGLIDNGV